jgi:hypothetical protein
MITLEPATAELIKKELESIPEKYQKPFNSMHEGLAILREEYVELESEIFWGEKKTEPFADKNDPHGMWKRNVRAEAVQVAAMACRIIQELTIE